MKSVEVKKSHHAEFRTISSALAGFSVATLLLIFDGGFDLERNRVFYASLLLVLAAPICLTSSLLSFIFTTKDKVPHRADSLLDSLMNLGWALCVVGFIFLVFSVKSNLGIALCVSILFSFLMGVIILKILIKAKEAEAE